MKSSPSNSNSGSFVMVALALLLVIELTSTFTAAYPASYSGYYLPVGVEEPNPSYVNLQQVIAQLRHALVDNNELENKDNIDRAISDLLELSRRTFHTWFEQFQERLKTKLTDTFYYGKNLRFPTKRSKVAVKGSQTDEFTLDGALKRTADFGSQRGHTGQKEYALRTKRAIDFGLGRGFSGSQAAKHLMGLAAANFAGGPGRRRRSSDDA